MTGRTEQAKSIFLSLLMVLSVIAIGSAGFAGSAAAVGGDAHLSPQNVVEGAYDQTVTVGIGEGTTSDITPSGTGVISLPSSSKVTFNTSTTVVGYSNNATGGTISISSFSFESDRKATFSYSGLDDSKKEGISITGVAIDVPDGASDAIDVNFGGNTQANTINYKEPSATFGSQPKINTGVEPSGAFSYKINADGTTGINGQHAQGENITISIPTSVQDRLLFNTSQSSLTKSVTDDSSGSLAVKEQPTFVDNTTISLNVTDADFDKSDDITVGGIKFDSLGVSDDSASAGFTTGLNVTTTPVDAIGTNGFQSTDTSDTVKSEAPTVELADNSGNAISSTDQTVAPGANGTDAAAVLITDSTNGGSAIGANTNVTVSLPSDAGITFDLRDEDALQVNDKTGSVTSTAEPPRYVDKRTITFETSSASTNSDAIALKGEGDNALEVNVTASATAQEVNLSVTTTPGGADVVQNTSTARDETSSAAIDVSAPKIDFNSDSGPSPSDLNINSGIHDQQVTVGTDDTTDDYAFKIISGASDDISDADGTGPGKNTTITLPADSNITFDAAQNDPLTQNTTGPSSSQATVVDSRTLNVTIKGGVSSSNFVEVDFVTFNVTGNINTTNDKFTAALNESDVSFQSEEIINATVTEPSVSVNGGSDLTLESDGDDEDSVDPDGDYSSPSPDDITLTSGDTGDLAEASQNKTTNITLDDTSVVEFDQSSSPTTGSGSFSSGEAVATVTGPNTVTVEAGGGDISSGSDIIVRDLAYNVSGDANVTNVGFSATENTSGVSFSASEVVNVTDITPDSVSGSGTSGEIGSTQTTTITVQNTSSLKSGGTHDFGDVTVDLNITSSPDAASVSNADNLNTTSITTRSDGTADFNFTLGSETGTYKVTASLASNSSVNTTLSYSADSGDATTLNVTKVEDAFVNDLSSADGDQKTAVLKVQVEDDGGNIVDDQNVKADLGLTGSASAGAQGAGSGVDFSDELNSNNYPANGGGQNSSSGAYTYDPSSDDSGQKGEFFLFVNDKTAESVTVTVIDDNGNVNQDSATVRFFDAPTNVSITTNRTTTNIGGQVDVTATLETSEGTPVTVPDSGVSFTSNSSSVLQRNAANTEVDTNGEATVNYTAQSTGTAKATANTFNSRIVSTDPITVEGYSVAGFTLSPSTATGNATVDHDLSYTVNSASNDGSEDTHTITLPNTTTISSVNSLDVTDARGNAVSVSSSASTSNADGGTDNQLTFGISPDSAGTSQLTVDANVSVSLPDVSSDTTETVNVSVADSNRGTDTASTSLTIEPETKEATFDVEDVSPDGATVTVGDAITVTADVENTGDESGTQTVEFRLDTDDNGTLEADEELANKSVSLDSGENKTVTFEDVSTDALPNETVTYDHGVFSEDDEDTATVTVEALAGDGGTVDIGDFSVPSEYVTDGGVTPDDLGDAAADFRAGDLTPTELGDVAGGFRES